MEINYFTDALAEFKEIDFLSSSKISTSIMSVLMPNYQLIIVDNVLLLRHETCICAYFIDLIVFAGPEGTSCVSDKETIITAKQLYEAVTKEVSKNLGEIEIMKIKDAVDLYVNVSELKHRYSAVNM